MHFSVVLIIWGELNRSPLDKNHYLVAGISAGDRFFSHCVVSGYFLFSVIELFLITAIISPIVQ